MSRLHAMDMTHGKANAKDLCDGVASLSAYTSLDPATPAIK